MHSQPARGHASDGWNQHNNNKSTECTHSVVYMYECGGGGGGGGGGRVGEGVIYLHSSSPPSSLMLAATIH